MRLEETLEVPVSQEEAWDFLWQTKRLAACLPGCTAVEEIEPGKRYLVDFQDGIGPYKVHFQMNVEVQETQAPSLVRILSTGQDKRLGASQKALLTVTLAERTPTRTDLHVEADVEILGKIASLGQFAIKRKAKDTVKRFAENIGQELRTQRAGAADA
jgi:carbon monoxide dehydrogenase subunit G